MPNSGRTRREPEIKGKGLSANGGFTIIELLILFAILAVVISTMVPMNRSSTEHREVIDSANSISEFLATARLEANIRGAETAVSYSHFSRSDWCLGFVTGNEACDCSQTDLDSATACVVDEELRVLNANGVRAPAVVNAMGGDGTFVFHPARGVAYDAVGRRIYDTAVIELESADQSIGLNVQVSSTGNISSCTHRGKQMIPGYHECLNTLR